MELYNDQVPSNEVWAVVIEDAGGTDIEWFLTAEASSDDYRSVVRWWEQHRGSTVYQDVTVTRWYVELPRRAMDRDKVDSWVETVIFGTDTVHESWRRRLDIKTFVTTEVSEARN